MGLFTFALSGLSLEPSFLSGSSVQPGTTNVVLTTTMTTTSDCFTSSGLTFLTGPTVSALPGPSGSLVGSSMASPTQGSSSQGSSDLASSVEGSTTQGSSGSASPTLDSSTMTGSTMTTTTSDSTASSTPTSFTTSPVSTSSDSTSITESTSTNTATDNDQPSATGIEHIAPTVAASSHTITVSGLGVVCAVLGSVLALF